MKYKFNVGEKVLCFEPDETKARVLYNAKIMDADILKDIKGKKYVEYKIHFQGWNHTWDRWANELFVLKDDEQNRKLQRKLAKKAIKKLKIRKGRKRHHLTGVASKSEGVEILASESSSDESIDSSVSTSTTKEKMSESEDFPVSASNKKLAPSARTGFEHKATEDDATGGRDEHHSRRILNVDIPQPLRRRLEEDNTMIKRRDMLVKLPVTPSVVQILDNYVKKFAIQYIGMVEKQKFATASSVQPTNVDALIPPEKRLNLCQEVCSDLKLLFDYTLPLVLLYSPERNQYKHVMRNTRVCADNSSAGEPSQAEMNSSSDILGAGTAEVPDNPESSLQVSPESNVSVHSPIAGLAAGQNPPQGAAKLPKKKNAETLMIEETHKYLIPNQPNLDQTGLSKDAQGRRRSSRLSHHDASPPRKVLITDSFKMYKTYEETLERKSTPTSSLYCVTSRPNIFLRAPLRPGRSSSISSLNPESPSASMGIAKPLLFNASPRMDRETYIFAVGGDIKNLVELKKAWDWSIVPPTYQPEDGATVPPSMIYGIHHLLRLFVKLPDILMKMEIPEFKLKVILKHLHSVLKFMNEYERELFEIDAYVHAHALML